jgi:outer membrane protein assembly factor BamD (BamD/ComL family)
MNNAWMRMLSATLVAAPFLFSGCSWLQKKEVPVSALTGANDTRGGDTGIRQVDYEEYLAEEGPEVDEFGIESLSPDNITDTVRQMSGFGPDKGIAVKKFAAGDKIFEEAMQRPEGDKRRMSQLNSAAAEYTEAAKRWPDSTLEEDALMMVGECYYFSDQYPKATAAYDALIKKYRNTRHMDDIADRRYRLAGFWIEKHRADPRWSIQPNLTDDMEPRFDTFGSATQLLHQIRHDDPTNALADDAAYAAAAAYYAQGDYAQADLFFTDVRKSYPNSEHQFKAHLLGLMCKLQVYQGPDYDGHALDEAQKLVETIQRQFPREAAAELEYLEKAAKEIRAKKAERYWMMADFYEGRGLYSGTRFHLNKIIKEFPTSSAADNARRRLEEIRDKPEKPPQRFKWLADLFPKHQPQQKPYLANTFIEPYFR